MHKNFSKTIGKICRNYEYIMYGFFLVLILFHAILE